MLPTLEEQEEACIHTPLRPTRLALLLEQPKPLTHGSGCRSGARQPLTVSTAKVPKNVFRPGQRGVTSLLRDSRPDHASTPTRHPPAPPDRLKRVIGAVRIILKPAEGSHTGHRSSPWGKVPRHRMKLSGRLPEGGDQRGTSRGETSPPSGSGDLRGDNPGGDAAADSDHHGTPGFRCVDIDISVVGASRIIGHHQR